MRGIGARALGSSQVSDWFNHTSNSLTIPSRPNGAIAAPYSSDGYNGIFDVLGKLIGAGTYYNPAVEAEAGAYSTPSSVPSGAIQVNVSQSSTIDTKRYAYRALDHANTNNGATSVGGESHTASAAGNWWAVDFGGRRFTATRLGYLNRLTTGGGPTSYVWQGSQDGSSWTDLTTGPFGVAAGSWATLGCTDTTAWRFIRIYQSGSGYLILGEVEMWGTLT